MQDKRYILGLFPDQDRTASAIEALNQTQWKVDRVHSPFPSHKIFDALKLKPSRVGYFTLTGGILGFLTGFALAVYTAIQWNLIVWGKPVVAWLPFVIVGFEFTILFSVFGNVIGLLIQTGLPEFESLKQYDPRCSAEHFGIVATCEAAEQEQLLEFFRGQGGETRVFDE
jgi:molybdopterin-containing oxidoreductase family membrane subunit